MASPSAVQVQQVAHHLEAGLAVADPLRAFTRDLWCEVDQLQLQVQRTPVWCLTAVR